MSAIRRVVFWVLLFAVPIQALAAPGWLCANAAHHPKQAQYHLHEAAAAPDLVSEVEGFARRTHELAAEVDQVDTEQATPVPTGNGKCSACSGCCISALAVPTIAASPAPHQRLHEVVAYISPAMTVRPADGLFRPPRTLTV